MVAARLQEMKKKKRIQPRKEGCGEQDWTGKLSTQSLKPFKKVGRKEKKKKQRRNKRPGQAHAGDAVTLGSRARVPRPQSARQDCGNGSVTAKKKTHMLKSSAAAVRHFGIILSSLNPSEDVNLCAYLLA